MPNHVHLILVPSDEDGLRRALAPAHRRYAGIIHARRKRTGHFWQGRFGCVAMDEEHLAAALAMYRSIRYGRGCQPRARLALVQRARTARRARRRHHRSGAGPRALSGFRQFPVRRAGCRHDRAATRRGEHRPAARQSANFSTPSSVRRGAFSSLRNAAQSRGARVKCTVTVIYVSNDPLNLLDPFGLSPDSPQSNYGYGYGANAQRATDNLNARNYGTAAYYELIRHTAETFLAMTPIGALQNAAAKGVSGATTGTSVWATGWATRGQAIEQSLGANLPCSFPVIDKFVGGTATSIKSIDLNAATYQNISSLTSRLNGYVDAVANFNGARFFGTVINSSQIGARQLQLAIPSTGASAAQQAAINAAATRAQSLGVGFVVTTVP